MERPAFTLGVEEEFQIIDPETRELRSHVQEILEEGRKKLGERVKPELHQSVVEVGTGICKNIQQARADVTELRTEIIRLAHRNGMRVAAAGTRLGSELELLDARGVHQRVQTGENGEAWLGPLLAGRYTVIARRDEGTAQRTFDVRGDERQAELELLFE